MIKFTMPSITSLEESYVLDSLKSNMLSGDGKYTEKVYEQFKNLMGIQNMLLTTSGTTALEMASLLINLKEGDEIIVPSFTFSSTVNAFMLRGAVPIFCDINKDTLNIDENLIESLITKKTKAIYIVDYAGIPCDIDYINAIAKTHNLYVIDDAAQAVGSKYKGKYLGNLTDFGCFSFHATKNYSMGEGGAILFQDEKFIDRAEILREKGTNRRHVLKGLVDKYTWHDIGSSFLPSDTLAAMLNAQMERFNEIMEKRMLVWNTYHELLEEVEKKGKLRRPIVPDYAEHNAHMYNIILNDAKTRDILIHNLRKKEIAAFICYVPLHSSPMGISLGWKPEMLPITEDYGQRVLRLPLYTDMTQNDAIFVCEAIRELL